MVQEKSAENVELRLDDFLRVVDVATAVRYKQEEVGQQLDIHETRDKLKERLKETASVTGEALTDSQIEVALDKYFEGLYSFKEPERDFGTKLAGVYAERGILTRRYVVPPLAIGITVAAGAGLISLAMEARLRGQEEFVEGNVKTQYNVKVRILSDIESIISSPFLAQLPKVERDRFDSFIAEAQREIKSTDAFFNQYCSDGTPEDDVTIDNFKEVENKLKDVIVPLAQADRPFEDGKSIVQTQEKLTIVARDLNTLMSEIKTANPHAILYNKAAQFYSAGQGEIERRNLSGAKQSEAGLREVKNNLSQFSDLTSRIESLYGSLTAVAVEQEALQKGEALYREAKQFAESVDVPRLDQSVSQLSNLVNVLEQEYTIRIVSRPGEKSAIDRYYDGKLSGWYIILEAIDSKGNVVPLDITNSEDGKTRKVRAWGEKVEGNNPRVVSKIQNSGDYDKNSLLQSMIADKIKDGVVDNNVVGRKEKGYLNYNLNNSQFLGVKITDW